MSDELAQSAVYLFAPQQAVRFRWNRNPDTPLPPEVPAGKNPPDGAIIDYYLATSTTTPVTLEFSIPQARSFAATPAPTSLFRWMNLLPTIPSLCTGFVASKFFPPRQACIVSFGMSTTLRRTR